MKRHYAATKLSVYLDGRCSDIECSSICSHIDECVVCRRRLTDLKTAHGLLDGLNKLETSEGFDFEFNRRLENALSEHGRAGIIERAAGNIAERIGGLLTPRVPAFAKTAVSFAIVLLIAVGIPYYFAGRPLDVIAVAGKAEAYLSGSRQWVDVYEGMKLAKNDVLRTGVRGHVDMGIHDIFIIRVKGDTEVKAVSALPRFRKGEAAYEVAKGEILIDITEKFKGSRFNVYTPQAVAQALGTSFMVNVSGQGDADETKLAVLHGKVKVENRYPLYASRAESVLVRAGERTNVVSGKTPETPSVLEGFWEWDSLLELHQIGRTPQVTLFISGSESRVRELLRPCSVFIYDKEPRVIPGRIEEAMADISEALAEGDVEKHLDAIHQLESIIDEAPDRSHNAPLLLFVGTYYEYVGRHDEAVETFETVVGRFPGSQFAGIAQCAAGIIYAEKLKDDDSAREAFENVIAKYPDSPEIYEAREGLRKLNF